MKYIHVIRSSELTSVPDDLQSAFVGMIFPVVDTDDPHVRDFMEKVREEIGDVHIGYFVNSKDVYTQLFERDFRDLGVQVRDCGIPYIWFAPDACIEIDKARLN